MNCKKFVDLNGPFQVSDVFRKAIESVPPEKVDHGNSDLKTLYDGLVMTENQLLSVSFWGLTALVWFDFVVNKKKN